MKTTKKIITGSLIFTLLFTTACSGKKPTPTPTPVPKAPVVEASGKVKAGVTFNVPLDFTTTIQQIHVKEGQQVKKGDTLFTIDLATISREIDQKQNELASQSANLQKLEQSYSTSTTSSKNQIVAEEAELNRLKSELESMKRDHGREISDLTSNLNLANTNLQNAQNDFDRNQALFQTGAISKVQLDGYATTLKSMQNLYQSALNALDQRRDAHAQAIKAKQAAIVQSQTRIDNYRLDIASPKAATTGDIEMTRKQKANIEIQLNTLKDKLNKPYLSGNRVICPLDLAVVGEITVKLGDNISNNPKLISLIDTQSLVVEAEVDEEAIKDVEVGADVVIKPVSNSAKQYKGKVLRIADMGVERNGSTVILTDISIDDRDDQIGAGYNVDVEIAKPVGTEVTPEPSPTKK